MSNEKVGIAMANKPSKPKLIQIKWPTPTVFCKNLLHVWGNHRGFPPEVRLSYEGFHVPCAWRCGLRGSASWQCRTWTTCNCSLDRIVNARTDAAEYCKSSARFVSFHLYASLSPLCDFRWFYWLSAKHGHENDATPAAQVVQALSTHALLIWQKKAPQAPHLLLLDACLTFSVSAARRHPRSTKSRCFIQNAFTFDTYRGYLRSYLWKDTTISGGNLRANSSTVVTKGHAVWGSTLHTLRWWKGAGGR